MLPSPTVPVRGTDLHYYLVSFDENSAERTHPAGIISQHLLKELAASEFTDVFLFSHGWMGDVGSANEQYQCWLKTMWALEDDRRAIRAKWPNFKPLLIGLHWPSLPWGNESLDAPLSFGDQPTSAIVDAYAKRLGETPIIRDAIQKVIDVALQADTPNQLPVALLTAYTELSTAVALPAERMSSAAPGADRDGFDPAQIYKDFQTDEVEQSVVSFGNSWRDSLLAPLRALSFWKMKDRARHFGEVAVNPLLHKIRSQAPTARVHLAGHSFGCIAASAAICGLPATAKQFSGVQSLILLQGALSLWSYCQKIPSAPNTAGYFHRLLNDKLVTGPIVTTQSKFDTAVGTWYPRGARVAGQVAFPGALPKYGAVGTFGVQGEGAAAKALNMLAENQAYGLQSGAIYNVEASHVINLGGGFSGAHSDIRKAPVAHLAWSAIGCL